MKRLLALATIALWIGAVLPQSVKAASPNGAVVTGTGRVIYAVAKGHTKAASTHNSPDMTNHGGKIMPTYVNKSIFWGPSWTSSSFVGDKISGLNTFYSGFSGSHYAITSDEYAGSNGQVGASGTNQGDVVDSSTVTSISTSAILAEVQKEVTAGSIIPNSSGNGYYPVYTDVPRGHNSYCAWHTSGTVTTPAGATVPIQFAFFFSLDGDAGCDPQSTVSGHSQGLAALANVSAHELSEARTDPASPGAWYDSRGSENGDKCAWTFNVPSVTFSNGSQWKLQGEWSNHAYDTNTGYPNNSGQNGCLDGR